MNDQPPNLPPPTPLPPRQVVIANQGMGCFAKGCLVLLIAGFILLGAVIAGCWYLYVKEVGKLTHPAPVDVQIEQPDENQFRTTEETMAHLRDATAENRETTVAFTAADLNALLARDLDLEELRGRVRIEIVDSTAILNLSIPLNAFPLPDLKGRWFNGTARFGFTYEEGEFYFDIKSVEAGDHYLPRILLSRSILRSFNEGINESIQDAWLTDDQAQEFWSHIKTMSLEGDKLIVTTRAVTN